MLPVSPKLQQLKTCIKDHQMFKGCKNCCFILTSLAEYTPHMRNVGVCVFGFVARVILSSKNSSSSSDIVGYCYASCAIKLCAYFDIFTERVAFLVPHRLAFNTLLLVIVLCYISNTNNIGNTSLTYE